MRTGTGGDGGAQTEEKTRTFKVRSACVDSVFRGSDVHFVLFGEASAFRRGGAVHRSGAIPHSALKGALHMKIVVVKSPKLFAGLLRAMFGIKKQTSE
ncbi:MAG: stage V sporulation protein SpoVM [Ruminococcaceae bacterium]|nr:stage V sporulation protein SpoVM [Oscillospiraceae bacterium]